MHTPKKAGVYCRLSYAPDGSVEKVERQEADCRQLAERLGWSVQDVYPDNSRSAWQRNRKRPEWDRMLADIKAGRLDGILVYHGDRLIRQPWDLELLLKLADDQHLPLASPSGTRDLNSEDDRFILRIEAAQACRSSADTSRRVKRDLDARAKSGRSSAGGNRPFGFGIPTGKTGVTRKPLYDLTQQVPEEAEVIREAVRRLLAGQSQGGVLTWMNSVCTTTNGNRWRPSGLNRVLRAPRIAGFVERGGQLHKASWDGIISEGDWEDVKSILQRNSDRVEYLGRERRYLLSGIAECATCEKPLHTKPIRRYRVYVCRNPGCGLKVARNVTHLDEYVIGRVLRRLNEPGFLAAVHADSKQPGVGAEIAALERRKAEAKATLEELADHPDVDPALLVKSLVSFDRKIKQLRDQLAASSRQRLLARMAGMTREQWDAEPIDVRAETVRALFRVLVLPVKRRQPGFDPDSVSVVRRTGD